MRWKNLLTKWQNVVKSGKYILYLIELIKMQHFIGTYECKADAKGRIMVPMPFKKQLAAMMQEGFVLKRAVFNSCLELYPLKEWDALMGRINKLNRFNKKNNDIIRRFTPGVKLVDIDASGRLLIPKDLIVHAGIEKEVVLSAAVNIIEVWDKQSYEAAIDAAKVDFGALAEEVMGDQDEVDLS